LRTSEARLKEAEQAALVGYWRFDVGTGQLIRSDQDVRNYGLEPGQMAPTFEAFLQAVHPDDRDMVKARVEKALSTLEPFHYEFRSLWPDGQVRTILTKCQMALDDDGNLVGMLGVNQDITERKRLESELLGRERLATLGQLTATVGHELRNPLGALRTSMYIVEKVADIKDDRFTRSVERIKRSVTRCDNIIDELLDFTRVQGLELAKTGLDRWLGTLLDELEVPESVEVKRKFGAPDTVVMADVDRFRRAVINVFNNGCQAMIGEGREDTGSAERNLTVRTQEHDGRIEVILEDTGPGIPPDVYERIFEPLYSTKGFGVGLGLPMVKQIMEQHGGGIEIESEEGRGTWVCLWLPHGHSSH
jgi:signal transduction histidine kinase